MALCSEHPDEVGAVGWAEELVGIGVALAVCVACEDRAPAADPEPADAGALPPEQIDGCTIHWLGGVGSVSIRGVAARPTGGFLVAGATWSNRGGRAPLYAFGADGSREADLARRPKSATGGTSPATRTAPSGFSDT